MNENAAPITPTRLEAAIFRGKAAVFQVRRGIKNLCDRNLRRFPNTISEFSGKSVIAESKTPLWTEKALAEQPLVAGKIQNLRIAARKLNGVTISAGAIFSFWKHVGKATRRRGFVAGRELREGCIIPNVGGGLCQLSNALYDAALKANFEIIERHAHSQIISGSLAEHGRDATVFWNYIDLRFKSSQTFRIEIQLDTEYLIVRFIGEKTPPKTFVRIAKLSAAQNQNQPQSCATCGVDSCFRVLKPPTEKSFGRTAYLLDEYSPEFDAYLKENKSSDDFLFVPLDGKRFKKANYAWTIGGFSKLKQSFFVTLERAYKSRKLAAQGAARQLNLLAMDEKLAESYAKNLPFDALHLVVQQNLLPFLWKSGALGGRTFDVLMTALPMTELQKKLDFAKNLHPESSTLGDFRAASEIIEAEREALQNARRIITAHTAIASLFPENCELLSWKMPEAAEISKVKNSKPVVYFPASTVGRKGVYELREALRDLDVKLIGHGAIIEAEDFWQGFDFERGNPDSIKTANLVVLPAFVEHKPRRLLQAAALKIPVLASQTCGVENVAGIVTIETGNAAQLRENIVQILSGAEEDSQKNMTHAAKSSLMFSK